jgi:hypothetical protein
MSSGEVIDPNGGPGVMFVTIGGTVGTVLKCKYCQHTNPPFCPWCKPNGEFCWGCYGNGGGVPVTTTITPTTTNDPPIIVTPPAWPHGAK